MAYSPHMDWLTPLVSVTLSSLVAFAVVGLMTTRQLRAQSREKVRLELEDAVQELAREVKSFQLGLSDRAKRTSEEGNIMTDVHSAARYLNIARRLGRWERAAIRKRCRRIFGESVTEYAELSWTLGEESGALAMAVAMASSGKESPWDPKRLINSALSGPPDTPDVEQLLKELAGFFKSYSPRF